MTPDLSSADVRALRPAHEPPDPWRPLDVMEEPEREAGRVAATATLFLAGGECRFTCVFCDLWRFTTPEPTPIGAIPAQIDAGLARLVAPIDTLKLYNASNFFDERAVPAADDDAILERVGGLERLVVECHPALVAERARRYARELGGRLEVAMGLETADEACHARLGKGTRVDDFRRAAERLHRADADVRIFLLVAPPFQARERRLS
ncbi:MAG: radical SAM protein, partial [Thermoanaerobaculia bacterium]|nr:radical SAM protein [Thermoanaerobaculia bacterium]